jgi:hypothetical protein
MKIITQIYSSKKIYYFYPVSDMPLNLAGRKSGSFSGIPVVFFVSFFVFQFSFKRSIFLRKTGQHMYSIFMQSPNPMLTACLSKVLGVAHPESDQADPLQKIRTENII